MFSVVLLERRRTPVSLEWHALLSKTLHRRESDRNRKKKETNPGAGEGSTGAFSTSKEFYGCALSELQKL